MSANEKAIDSQSKSQSKSREGQVVTIEDALQLAQSHHTNGNFIIADMTYRDILRTDPDHFPTVYFMAVLCFQRGQLKEALEYATKSIEVGTDNLNVWVNYGSILSANKKYEEALEAFEEAIAIEPEMYEAHTNKAYTLWLMNRFEESEEAALQAIMLEPDSVEGHINLGVALSSLGKYEEANETWEQAAALAPDNAKIYANWANSLREMYAYLPGKEKGEKAIALDPKNAEAFCNLGNIQRDLGEYEEAVQNYRQAIALKPSYVVAHLNLAMTLCDLYRYADALTAARSALSYDEDDARCHYVVSMALFGMHQIMEAYSHADKAVHFDKTNPLYKLNLAEIMIANDSFDEADIIIKDVIANYPKDLRTLLTVAEIKRGLDDVEGSLAALETAIGVDDVQPALFLRKAQVLKNANRLDEALQCVNQVLAAYPEHPTAYITKAEMLLTGNRREEAELAMDKAAEYSSDLPAYYVTLTAFRDIKKEDAEYQRLVHFYEESDSYGPEMKSSVAFALSQIHENYKEYDVAFDYLQKANDARLEARPDYQHDYKYFPTYIKDNFHEGIFDEYQGMGAQSDVPIFIVGMPRSGTTLTEQILSAHPDVFGAGELYELQNVVRTLGPLRPEKAQEIGESYVERVMALTHGTKPRFITDKMPGNYQRIGIIQCILPNAKIIHCRRSPLDTLLSCYKQNFATGHAWTYNLEHMAGQYRAYREVMDYWAQQLPDGRILHFDYEETVNDFETQARRLIDYVGLAWDDACLEPHKQKRAVLTASRDQVTKPIYKTSVDAWKRYEDGLQPLVERLKADGFVT
jgi:tetratricopeptide (TPR) repeat protein